MGDWRRSVTGWDDSWAHPDSPSGGTGAGFARPPNGASDSRHVPHPDSPAGRSFDGSVLLRFELAERASAVYEAMRVAERKAPQAILDATGEELAGILEGIVPGLLLCLCVVGATTAIGGAAGAAIGALAGGVGAAPGAIAGAGLGLEAGVALLELLGIALLIEAIGSGLSEAFRER